MSPGPSMPGAALPSSVAGGPWNKVPVVAASFWAIKLLSTTVGETIADTLAVGVGLGQRVTGAGMALLLAIALVAQLRARQHQPWLYWLTVVLVSVVGTQITDALTDGLGVPLAYSTTGFGLLLVLVFAAWWRQERTLDIRAINSLPRELWYWAAILCTFALGTAAGDLATEALGLGFQLGVLVFSLLILACGVAWKVGLGAIPCFWAAYILTRPLGAALGDWLSQARTYGGLGFGAAATSVLFLAVITALVLRAQVAEQRGAARHAAAA